MSESQEQLPEWMLRLENKRKKQHRLAHDIGAGAPCFVCQDNCPGLDLHFWRKLCRNCKCKKEDHDVKDDEGYEQFEILLGNEQRRSRKGGFLQIKVPEDSKNPITPLNNSSKGISFDWLPPNVSEEVAAEYMQQLPAGKLPISGSDGALYRRQQLTKQVPLHDLDARRCHNLTPEEIEQLMKYLENLKSNVVGQGCVGKIPGLYTENRIPLPGPVHLHSLNGLGRPLASSQSADPIRPLPPMPPAYNSMPRPFHASSSSSAYGSGEDEDLPPPLPTSLPPRTDLKTPSEFMPDWRLPDDRSTSLGKVVGGVLDMQLKEKGIPSHHIKDAFPKETTLSSSYGRQQPQFSGNLPSTKITPAVEGLPQGIASRIEDPQEAGVAVSQRFAPSQGNAVLQSQLMSVGNHPEAVHYVQNMIDPKHEALSGARIPGGVVQSITNFNSDNSRSLPAHSSKVSSLLPQGTATSSIVDQRGVLLSSKPLGDLRSMNAASVDSLKNINRDIAGVLPINHTKQSMVLPTEESLSESVRDMKTTTEPCEGKKGVNTGSVDPTSNTQLLEGDKQYGTLPDYNSGKNSLSQPTYLNYGAPLMNQHNSASSLPIDGVKMSNVIPHTVIQSSVVGTDALPKSAQIMQQLPTSVDPTLAAAFAGSTGPLPAETPGGSVPHLDCQECGLMLLAGDIAVFAERAGNSAWHPSCFVCFTCKELLVDLMYFYHKNNVYCGRHFAELLGIPRCFACDELIFVKEYTVAEGKAFHVKHYCCYECDDPLAGKQYIPVDNQPVCLECYERKYGKQCHTCQKKIAAGEQRVGWKHLNWHVQGNCFCCFECGKSLLGGRFVVKENQPFCSKECVQAGLQKMAGTA